MAVLAVVLVASAVMLVRQQMEYRRGEEIYQEAESLVELPDLSELPAPEVQEPEEETEQEEKPVYVDPYADALRNMDFTVRITAAACSQKENRNLGKNLDTCRDL